MYALWDINGNLITNVEAKGDWDARWWASLHGAHYYCEVKKHA